jgi:hypothetical protein
MMRFALLLTISLVTFVAGLASSWTVNSLWYALTGPEESITTAVASVQDLDVGLAGTLEFEGLKYADLIVTNRGSETAYYTGYSRDSHCSYMIRQHGLVRQGSFCWCGTGLAEQALGVGETVVFQVPVPKNSGSFEVGLDFEMGDARLKRTVWSRTIFNTDSEWIDLR